MRGIGILVSLAAAMAGCDQPVETPEPVAARESIAKIRAEQAHCREDAEAGPVERQACDGEAIDAAARLIPKARNGAFQDMMSAMFETLLFAHGAGDALAYRGVVTSSYADLALARADILTGSEPTGPAGGRPTFAAFVDQSDDLAQIWSAVRRGDCEAYPVADCAARLDAVFSAMLNEHLAPDRHANDDATPVSERSD